MKIYKYIHFNTLIKVLYALRKYKSYKLLKVAKTFKINPESYKNLFYKESLISSHHPQINGGTREGWIYNKYLWKNIYENIQMYSYLTDLHLVSFQLIYCTVLKKIFYFRAPGAGAVAHSAVANWINLSHSATLFDLF